MMNVHDKRIFTAEEHEGYDKRRIHTDLDFWPCHQIQTLSNMNSLWDLILSFQVTPLAAIPGLWQHWHLVLNKQLACCHKCDPEADRPSGACLRIPEPSLLTGGQAAAAGLARLAMYVLPKCLFWLWAVIKCVCWVTKVKKCYLDLKK